MPEVNKCELKISSATHQMKIYLHSCHTSIYSQVSLNICHTHAPYGFRHGVRFDSLECKCSKTQNTSVNVVFHIEIKVKSAKGLGPRMQHLLWFDTFICLLHLSYSLSLLSRRCIKWWRPRRWRASVKLPYLRTCAMPPPTSSRPVGWEAWNITLCWYPGHATGGRETSTRPGGILLVGHCINT